MTIKLKVSTKPGCEKFFRCGIEFSPKPIFVDVDLATAQRLNEEQMLIVVHETEQHPPDPLPPAPVDPAPVDPASSGQTPTQQEDVGKKKPKADK